DLAPPAPGRELRARGAPRRPRPHGAGPRRRRRGGHVGQAVGALRPGRRGARNFRTPHGVSAGGSAVSVWSAFDFWRDSMAAVLLAGAMCAALGVYVVLRRVVFVGAALTQISGVGVALAFWLASFATGEVHEAPIWLDPRWLSLIAALIGAISFSFTRGGRGSSPDTGIGLGWVVAGGTLLLILSSKRIVQEAHEVDDLLYGSAVLVREGEVVVLGGVVAAVLAVHALFFKELLFVTFDAEMAQTLGYNVRLWD